MNDVSINDNREATDPDLLKAYMQPAVVALAKLIDKDVTDTFGLWESQYFTKEKELHELSR